MGDATVAYNLLLNLQWLFIGLTLLLVAYDVVEFARTRLKRYLSYGFGRLGFALMVGVIGVLLATSPDHAVPWTPELAVWLVGLVWMGQSIIVKLWEIRQDRKGAK